jgi:hypothetical protein
MYALGRIHTIITCMKALQFLVVQMAMGNEESTFKMGKAMFERILKDKKISKTKALVKFQYASFLRFAKRYQQSMDLLNQMISNGELFGPTIGYAWFIIGCCYLYKDGNVTGKLL